MKSKRLEKLLGFQKLSHSATGTRTFNLKKSYLILLAKFNAMNIIMKR